MDNIELNPKKFLNNAVDRRELADYIALYNTSTAVGEILNILSGGYVPPVDQVDVTLVSPEGENSIYDFDTKLVKVDKGEKLNSDSAGEDYVLTGYYTNEDLTEAFDYANTPITAPITLYVTGHAMRLAAGYNARLNSQEDNMTAVHFVLAGEEPSDEPSLTWDASEGKTGAVTAKMYEGGVTYFVAREGATHIYAPEVPSLLSFCTALTTVTGIDKLYGVKDFSQAFASSGLITTLDGIEELDTSNVTSLYQTFAEAGVPATMDLSNWDTSNCMDFNRTFARVRSSSNITCNGWVIPEGAIVEKTFIGENNSAQDVQSYTLRNWDIRTDNIDGAYLFAQHAKMVALDITGWDFSKFVSARQMFWSDYELQEIIRGEKEYFEFPNLTKIETYAGMHNAFYNCYNLNKFHNTGDYGVDHTLTIRLPNTAGLISTQVLEKTGVKTDPFYLDIDLVESVYEEAGDADIQLVAPGNSFVNLTNAKQIKFFGNYNDKWEGSVASSNHTNLIIPSSTSLNMNQNDSATIDGVVYPIKFEALIMDRYIPSANRTVGPSITNSIKWILVHPSVTPEQAKLIGKGSISNSEMALRGYYDGGVWQASKVPLVTPYIQVATPTERGYLTTNPDYIIPSEEDPTVIGGTLAEFSEAVKAGNLSKFPIGTEIPDTYGNEEAPLIVAEYLDSSNNTAYGGAEGGILMRKYVAAGTTQWDTSTSNSYNLSTVYDYINGSYYEGCSDELKTIVSDITVPYNDVSTKTIEEVSGKVFIPSTDEISLPSATTTVGIRFTYWSAALATSTSTNSPNRIGYNVTGDKKAWWTRTAGNTGTSDAGKAYLVTTSGTTQYNSKTLATPTVRPFFFVSKNA